MQRDKDIKEHDIQVTERGDSQSCYSISGSQDRRGGSENFGRTEMERHAIFISFKVFRKTSSFMTLWKWVTAANLRLKTWLIHLTSYLLIFHQVQLLILIVQISASLRNAKSQWNQGNKSTSPNAGPFPGDDLKTVTPETRPGWQEVVIAPGFVNQSSTEGCFRQQLKPLKTCKFYSFSN